MKLQLTLQIIHGVAGQTYLEILQGHNFNKHTDEKHTDEKHTDEKHTDEKHTDEKHTDEKHTDEKHTDEKHRNTSGSGGIRVEGRHYCIQRCYQRRES
jgi:hypothetical protein